MAVSIGRTSHAKETATLKVGDTAPAFALKSQTGESWQLADARGRRNVVLAFYPFAFSDV